MLCEVLAWDLGAQDILPRMIQSAFWCPFLEMPKHKLDTRASIQANLPFTTSRSRQ